MPTYLGARRLRRESPLVQALSRGWNPLSGFVAEAPNLDAHLPEADLCWRGEHVPTCRAQSCVPTPLIAV